MNIHPHRAFIFSNEIDKTVNFYMKNFDARIAYDGDWGARNVFMEIGSERSNIYAQSAS